METTGAISMKTFKVVVSSISYYTVEIEAENDDEAWDIARDMDGGDFEAEDVGDWEIYSVSEVEK
jgi:hypothetical protein